MGPDATDARSRVAGENLGEIATLRTIATKPGLKRSRERSSQCKIYRDKNMIALCNNLCVQQFAHVLSFSSMPFLNVYLVLLGALAVPREILLHLNSSKQQFELLLSRDSCVNKHRCVVKLLISATRCVPLSLSLCGLRNKDFRYAIGTHSVTQTSVSLGKDRASGLKCYWLV